MHAKPKTTRTHFALISFEAPLCIIPCLACVGIIIMAEIVRWRIHCVIHDIQVTDNIRRNSKGAKQQSSTTSYPSVFTSETSQ